MAARTYGVLALVSALGASALGACSAESRSAENKAGTQHSALNTDANANVNATSAGTLRFAWGEKAGQIGFRPSFRESLPLGAPAIAVGTDGQVFVLDALNERVSKVLRGNLVPVASVPHDADDIAVAPDGAFAVHRVTKAQVTVYGPNGESMGNVDVSAIPELDGISLGTSRRVFVNSAFQETFLVGSPSLPQAKSAILAGKREGAAIVAGNMGVATVRTDSGELELRVLRQGEERTTLARTIALGKGAAARVVGASGAVACVRIEQTSQEPGNGAIGVEREAACVDVRSGDTVFRTKLPAPGAYLPRRELAFGGGKLAFAHAEADGLAVTVWDVKAIAEATDAKGGAR
ncbi:hypothetical protein AKJ09_07150 [Labilithrix luteola]|uniref:NHL repeat domain protein n=1 Tax=Labilithrix luteola TaxID=1391654 RepID=A0A0K1Q4A6_9BACT|nr:hypothetical protein [Labilithrix luteola]AKV00487.1 hypothetical protein AKJ09_07150 [Labilithrix luteola]